MAQERIEIEFKPKGDKAVVQAVKQLDVATKRLEGTTSAYEKELKDLGLTSQQVTAFLSKQTKNLRIQAGAFATIRSNLLLYSFAVGLAQAAVIRFVSEAGKLEDLQRAFSSLSKGIGGNTKSLSKLQQATDGTVSKIDLLKQANNAMLLGIAQSDDEMAQLFDTAQRLGQAMGVDTTDAINSMVTGMGRQSKLMLDNLGILIDAKTAYENYAEANDLSTKSLTDSQKKEAFNQEVLRVSKEKVNQLGKEILSTTQAMSSLSASSSNLSATIGQALAPVVISVAKAMRDITEAIDVKTVKSLIVFVSGLTLAYVLNNNATLKAIYNQAQLAAFYIRTGSAAIGLTTAVSTLNVAMSANWVGIIITGLAAVAAAYTYLTSTTGEVVEATDTYGRKIKTTTEIFNANRKAMGDNTDAMQKELDILNESDPVKKQNIKLGYEMLELEEDTFLALRAKKQEIKDLEAAEKAREKTQKQIADVLQFVDNIGKDSTIVRLQGYRDLLLAEEAYNLELQETTERSRELQTAISTLNALIKKQEDGVDKSRKSLKDLNQEYREYIFEIKDADAQDKNVSNFKAKNNLLKERQEHLDKLTTLQGEFNRDTDKSNDNLITDNMLSNLQNQITLESTLLEEQKKQATIDANFEIARSVVSLAEAYTDLTQQQLDADKAIQVNAANSIKSERLRKRKLDEINKEFESKQDEINKENKRIKRVQTVINTASAVMEVLSDKSIPQTWQKLTMASLVAAQGVAQVAIIDSAKYETGGMVGGRRHSQGGTMIEAERGEYVVSRQGVESAGIEALNRINAGGTAGSINVNISGNVLSKDFIEDEAIPQIKEAIRRGADIGIG